MVARGMAAFLSVHVPTEDQIRLKPSSELHLTPKAQQVSKNNLTVKGWKVSSTASPEGGGGAPSLPYHDVCSAAAQCSLWCTLPTGKWLHVPTSGFEPGFVSTDLEHCHCHCRRGKAWAKLAKG